MAMSRALGTSLQWLPLEVEWWPSFGHSIWELVTSSSNDLGLWVHSLVPRGAAGVSVPLPCSPWSSAAQ